MGPTYALADPLSVREMVRMMVQLSITQSQILKLYAHLCFKLANTQKIFLPRDQLQLKIIVKHSEQLKIQKLQLLLQFTVKIESLCRSKLQE